MSFTPFALVAVRNVLATIVRFGPNCILHLERVAILGMGLGN